MQVKKVYCGNYFDVFKFTAGSLKPMYVRVWDAGGAIEFSPDPTKNDWDAPETEAEMWAAAPYAALIHEYEKA
jgi:hypothetical protein